MRGGTLVLFALFVTTAVMGCARTPPRPATMSPRPRATQAPQATRPNAAPASEEDNETPADPPGTPDDVIARRFGNDGRYVRVLSPSQITTFDGTSGAQISRREIAGATLLSAAALGGKAVLERSGKLYVLDLETEKETPVRNVAAPAANPDEVDFVLTPAGLTYRVPRVSLSADASKLGVDRGVKGMEVVDLDTGRTIAKGIGIRPTGNAGVARRLSHDGRFVEWINMRSARVHFALPGGADAGLYVPTYAERSPDGRFFVVAPDGTPAQTVLEARDGTTGARLSQLLATIDRKEVQRGGPQVAFCGSTGRVAIATRDEISVFALPSGGLVSKLLGAQWRKAGDERETPALACANDGTRLAVFVGERVHVGKLP